MTHGYNPTHDKTGCGAAQNERGIVNQDHRQTRRSEYSQPSQNYRNKKPAGHTSYSTRYPAFRFLSPAFSVIGAKITQRHFEVSYCISTRLTSLYAAMVEEDSEPSKFFEGVPDNELVRRAQADDLEAYQALMSRYQPRIHSLIYNMTSNKEDTEDLLQEVFIKAHSALPKFKGKSSFYTWVYRIAVNRSINFLKKRKRRSALSLNDIDSGIERDEVYVEISRKNTPFRDARLNEIQEKLNAAIQRLSDKHRTVVVMHDIEGISHDQIAEIIGVSSGTVRSRLFYARKQLQAELSEFMNEI